MNHGKHLILIFLFATLPLIANAKQTVDAVSYFNLGVTKYKAGEFEASIAAFETVVILKSKLAPVAQIYEASIYLKIGKKQSAKDVLQKVTIESLPPNLKQRALLLKNRLFMDEFSEEADLEQNPNELNPLTTAKTPAKSEKDFSALFDISYGYNKNPQTLADVGSQVSGDQQTQIKASGDYLSSSSSVHDFKLGYSFSGTYFSREKKSNYTGNDLTAPVALYFDRYRLRITPEFYFDYYGGDAFSQSTGGSIELSRKVGDSYVGLSAAHQSIKNLTTSYSYLSGSQDKLQATFQSQWSLSSAFVNAYYGKLNYTDTATLVSSYTTVGMNLGYRYLFLPFDVSVSGAIETHSYDKATSGTTARFDLKTFADVQLGYSISRQLRAYIDVNRTDNTSNFNTSTDNRSYNQMIFLLGLAFGI